MGKLWLRRTDLFIPFGSKSGKRLWSLGFQSWPRPPAEWLSCQASVRDSRECFPAARLGAGGGRGLWAGTASNTRHSPLPAPRAQQGKKDKTFPTSWCLVQDLFPSPILLLSKNVFWYEPKVCRTAGAKSNTIQCNAAGASLPFPRQQRGSLLLLPALCSVSPVPVWHSNEMLPLTLTLLQIWILIYRGCVNTWWG